MAMPDAEEQHRRDIDRFERKKSSYRISGVRESQAPLSLNEAVKALRDTSSRRAKDCRSGDEAG
jgi:hypothetical protein